MANIFSSKAVRILSLVLLAQAGIFYGFSRQERIPLHKPLQEFSLNSPTWTTQQDISLDKETLEVLQADDILSRTYKNNETGVFATLFVAYFQTQRTGKTPHSPKNCLPGSGWVPSESGYVEIPIAGQMKPISVNHYVVSRGDNQSIVLYWYQSHNRVVASEYSAKIFTVTDAIRYNRSDTSLVRVVIGADHGDGKSADKAAIEFVQSFFEPLKAYLAT
jgi:EpsI family protein